MNALAEVSEHEWWNRITIEFCRLLLRGCPSCAGTNEGSSIITLILGVAWQSRCCRRPRPRDRSSFKSTSRLPALAVSPLPVYSLTTTFFPPPLHPPSPLISCHHTFLHFSPLVTTTTSSIVLERNKGQEHIYN